MAIADRFFLDTLGILENTDKSCLFQDYLSYYGEYFACYRDKPINVIEIGVLGGGSLRMWERYFPLATIIGIDIMPRAKQHERGRVVVEIGSQVDPVFLGDVVKKYPPTIIIDDGSHRADYTVESFRILFPAVQPRGCYVIEDLHFHFGPSAKDFRGDATATPVDYLQTLVSDILGAKHRNRDAGVAPSDQIDRLAVIPGAAFIWKKPEATQLSALLPWAEGLVEQAGHARGWFFLSKFILSHRGSLEQAEAAARRAISMDSSDPRYHAQLADVLERRGDLDGALSAVRAGLAIRGSVGRWLEPRLARLTKMKAKNAQ